MISRLDYANLNFLAINVLILVLHINTLGLDEKQEKSVLMMQKDLAFLVRVKRVDLKGIDVQYKDEDIDGQKIQIGII